MSYATSQTLQLVAWFMAILDFVLMLYVFLLNPRHIGNRGVSALFLVITLNTLSVGLVLDPTPVYRIGLPLYVAASTSVVAGILVVTAVLIKPEWLPRGWQSGARRVWFLIYALSTLPIVLTLVDVLFGTRLWYTPPVDYAGGFVPLAESASGVISRFLRPLMTYVMGSLPVLMLVYLLARDRKMAFVTRRMAWLLLGAQVIALVLMSTLHGPVVTPAMTLVVSVLYAISLAYATFRQMISERRAQAGRVRTRLTVLLLVVALPLFAGLLGVVLSRADTAIQLKSDEQMTTAGRAVVSNTTTWLDLNVAALNELVMLPQIIGMDAAEQKPILEAMAATHPQMYLVSTTDPQGMNVARNDAGKLTDYSDRAWYKGAIGGAPLTLQMLIGRTTGRPALVASAPILAEPGSIVGVGMFASELTDVARQVQLSMVGEAGFSYVVDTDNLVVAYPETLPAELGDISSSVPITPLGDLSDYPPVKALRSGSRGRIEFTDKAGRQWQAYVDEMQYGWGVVVQQPNEDFLSALSQLQAIALAFIAGGVLLLLGLMVLTVRQALQPVGGLTETAVAIAGGDLERSAPVESEDEFGTLGRAFNRMTGQLRDLIGGLEQRVAERTADLERRSAYLQASAEVGRAVGSILDADALAGQVVELIRERFGLYYVGLFLTDATRPASPGGDLRGASGTGGWAVLQAGTGEAGRAMLARGHRVQVGQGMVGWSIAHAQARVALQAEADAVRLATPELSETRSEAALPLRSRGHVLGALTVQSTEAQAFDADAIAVLQTMADQVAVALDNARLFEESREALESVRRAYGEVSREAWGELLHGRQEWGYRYAQGAMEPTARGGPWPAEMVQAVETGQSVASPGQQASPDQPGREDGAVLAIPLKVRNEVVGVLSFRKDPGDPLRGWTTEEKDLLEALIDQVGTALDSARLYQATQQRAVRERLTSEVTARIRETLDMETVLRTAVQEVRQALGLPEVVVRLRDPRNPGRPGREGSGVPHAAAASEPGAGR